MEGQNACIKGEMAKAYSESKNVIIKFSLNLRVPSCDLESTGRAVLYSSA